MTDIDQLPAGRAADALVAEKVMEWTEVMVFHQIHCGIPPEGDKRREGYDVFFGVKATIPEYSADIEAAFEVVDKLLDGTRTFLLECWSLKNDHWQAMFKGAARYEKLAWASAETRPLAICRAALRVMAED